MTISLPIKAFLGGLAIMVSLASAAQAGRPLIQSEDACRDVAKYYDLSWGGAKSKYETKGCYYYENGQWAGKAYFGTGGWLGNYASNTGDGTKAKGKRRFDQVCAAGLVHGETAKNQRIWDDLKKVRSKYKILCDCTNKEHKKTMPNLWRHGCIRDW
jgi:hypothetical protein